MNLIYEAQLVFQKVDDNIFKIYKSRKNLYKRDVFVGSDRIIKGLNETYKVLVIDDKMQTIVKNF